MKLIADSGGTKTDWAVFTAERKSEIRTQGINPIHQTDEDIRKIVLEELVPLLNGTVDELYFYGSGCRKETTSGLSSLFRALFPDAEKIEVNSDLLGAARALYGHEEGIACILGTGANSCYYDGRKIVKNTPSMGYILGDEGSGAVLGRNFVNALFRGVLPESLKNDFCEEFNTNLDDIIRKVYTQPLANRFLASLAVYVRKHIDVDGVRKLVIDNFRSFFVRNIKPYGLDNLPVNAVGSVAWYFSEEFKAAAVLEGYRVDKIMKSPLEGLVAFHKC